MPIRASSKLDRHPAFLKRLVEHGEEQAEQLLAALRLAALRWQLRFEEVWEEALRTLKEEADADGAVEAVADLFAEDAVVALVPPEGSPAGGLQSNGRERLRDFLRWCLHKNFRIEQTRDYQAEGTSIRSWLRPTGRWRPQQTAVP